MTQIYIAFAAIHYLSSYTQHCGLSRKSHVCTQCSRLVGVILLPSMCLSYMNKDHILATCPSILYIPSAGLDCFLSIYAETHKSNAMTKLSQKPTQYTSVINKTICTYMNMFIFITCSYLLLYYIYVCTAYTSVLQLHVY